MMEKNKVWLLSKAWVEEKIEKNFDHKETINESTRSIGHSHHLKIEKIFCSNPNTVHAVMMERGNPSPKK